VPGSSRTPNGGDSSLPVAVICVATVLASATAGVTWLAAAVDDDRSGHPLPGNPLFLLRAVATGQLPAPSTLGWAVAGAVIAAALVLAVSTVVLVLVRTRRDREPVDAAAAHLGRGRALRRLHAPAVLATARRLGSAVGDTPGPLLGRTVAGRRPLYTSCEMVTLIVAGTRSGKSSAFAIPTILDAPGPVIATSNKADLVERTAALRALTGSVWVFDPQGLVVADPTWWWDPLADVTSLSGAELLADHFAEDARNPRSGGDAYFDGAGRSLLAGLLMAAAADRRPVTDIHGWLTDPTDDTPAVLLRTAGHTAVADAVRAVVTAPDRQRAGVYGTALQMVACLTNPTTTRWVTPPPDENTRARRFDPAAFVTSRDTLYSLSREGRGSAGALVTALTVAVTQAAEVHASTCPGGRLRVPLTGVLDEAANVCRWRDLPQLYSHYGSRGILLSTYVQSPSQGVQLWGEQGWATLRDSANVLVYAGGVKDRGFLSELSDLIGTWERPTDSVSHSQSGRSTSRSTRREPVLDAAALAALPLGRAVVLVSGTPATLIRTVPYQDGPHAAAITAAATGATGEQLRAVVDAHRPRTARRRGPGPGPIDPTGPAESPELAHPAGGAAAPTLSPEASP
jgi:type IV secretory pathway TraG/TraD family ATPase VirD4